MTAQTDDEAEPEEEDNFFKPLENELVVRGKTMFFPNVPRLELRCVVHAIEKRKNGPWTLLVGHTPKSIHEIVRHYIIKHDIFVMAESRGYGSLRLPFEKDKLVISLDPHNLRLPTSFHLDEGMEINVEASISINLSPKSDRKAITLKVKRVVTQ